MDGRTTVLLAGVPTALDSELRRALPDAQFTVLTNVATWREQLRDPKHSLAVVVVDPDEASFRLVNALTVAGTHVVVVGPTKDPDLILRAMREGAREFVLADDTEGVIRALRDQGRAPRAMGVGQVVSIFPARGGAGATSIAVNLAGSLARRGERVCLVDLDLSMGDVLSFLDVQGGYTIADVVTNIGRLDRALLDASVASHASGMHVLSQVERIDAAVAVDPAAITTLLDFLRHQYAFVIVDGLHTFDDHAVAALDGSEHVLLVTTQEVPSVRRAQRCASFLRRLGHEDRIRLLVNRYDKSTDVKLELITDTVGLPVAATLSSDYPALVRCINRGTLLADDAPRSALNRDLEALQPLVGYHRGSEGKPGLFKRLFSQKPVSHAAQ